MNDDSNRATYDHVKRVAVIGAGVAGLQLAERLGQKPGLELTIFEARAKFELKLTLTSEATEAPLFWAVDAPTDLFTPAVDVERVVGAACERYTRGFGRLCDIYCAIDAQMRAPRA